MIRRYHKLGHSVHEIVSITGLTRGRVSAIVNNSTYNEVIDLVKLEDLDLPPIDIGLRLKTPHARRKAPSSRDVAGLIHSRRELA